MHDSSTSSPGLIERYVRLTVYHPKAVLAVVAALCIGAVFLVLRLQVKSSNLDLIDPNIPEVHQFMEFANRFGTPNTLLVVFEGKDPEQLKDVVDKAAETVRKTPGVRRVMDRNPIDPIAFMQRQASSYFANRDGSAYFLFVQPVDTRTDVSIVAPLVAEVESHIKQALAGVQGVTIGYTGIPRYALDDQTIIQRDIKALSFLSLGFVFLLFVLGFHGLKGPLLATAVMVISVHLTLASVALYPGYLTILSATFAMIVFGNGIDYGVHIIHRLEELLQKGEFDPKECVVHAVTDLRRTLLTACFATVAAFGTLLASGFLGFEELGVIAGIGLIICLLCMIGILPALLSLFPLKPPPERAPDSIIVRAILAVPRNFFGPLLLVASCGILFLKTPAFDSDYLNLQPKDSNAVRLERMITNDSDYSPYFAAFVTDSLEEAARLAETLRKDPTVGAVRSITDFKDLKLEQLPAESRGVFDSADGKFAVYAFPGKNIWDPANEQDFLARMRAVSPEVTGMPILGSVMVEKTKRALRITAFLSLSLLVVVVTLDFRKPIQVLLVVLTPILAAMWMQAGMHVLGVSYNPLNIMALPIVLGIGVDNSVHLVHRFLFEHGDSKATLAGSGRSVVLTALTTLSAFACLIPTTHMGLRSFSLILTLGLIGSLVISLTVLPWLLEQLKPFVIGSGTEPERM